MQPLIQREFNGRTAYVAHSTRADGDLSPSTVEPGELALRRQRAVPSPWCAVRQVHSDRVIVVRSSQDMSLAPRADAMVTSEPDLVIAVHSGDCVPVGFIDEAGTIAVAHAGWKGLEAGVLESTVRCMGESARGDIVAAVGPHIRAPRYEFGSADLARLSNRFGSGIVATTDQGTPALDLTHAIGIELDRLGVEVAAWSPDCTAQQNDRYWSHRARREQGRIALVAWLESGDEEQSGE